MTLNRWKVLACTLTVGVGGLAVFATPPSGTKADPAKDPAPLPPMTVKPASPVNGDDTPAPILPVKAEEPAKPVKTEELEFSVPLPPLPPAPVVPPTKAPPVTEPANLPVFESVAPAPMPAPMLLLPVAGEEPKVTAPKPSPVKPPMVDTVPPIPLPGIPKPDVKLLPLPEAPKAPKAPMVDKVPLPETPKAPMIDFDAPPLPRTSPPPAPPMPPSNLLPPPTRPSVPDSPAVSPKPTKPPVADAKLKMLLRIGDGQPRFEIRNSATTELLLKVYGEKIEMAAPPEGRPTVAGVMAIGRVKFTAPGIEGTCDHLTILSGTGEVLLKGNIHLKTKYGKSWSEMTAEKMVYQIGTNGLSAPSRPTVTPASYIPD